MIEAIEIANAINEVAIEVYVDAPHKSDAERAAWNVMAWAAEVDELLAQLACLP